MATRVESPVDRGKCQDLYDGEGFLVPDDGRDHKVRLLPKKIIRFQDVGEREVGVSLRVLDCERVVENYVPSIWLVRLAFQSAYWNYFACVYAGIYADSWAWLERKFKPALRETPQSFDLNTGTYNFLTRSLDNSIALAVPMTRSISLRAGYGILTRFPVIGALAMNGTLGIYLGRVHPRAREVIAFICAALFGATFYIRPRSSDPLHGPSCQDRTTPWHKIPAGFWRILNAIRDKNTTGCTPIDG